MCFRRKLVTRNKLRLQRDELFHVDAALHARGRILVQNLKKLIINIIFNGRNKE
jgi:hypothetical protein